MGMMPRVHFFFRFEQYGDIEFFVGQMGKRMVQVNDLRERIRRSIFLEIFGEKTAVDAAETRRIGVLDAGMGQQALDALEYDIPLGSEGMDCGEDLLQLFKKA